MDHVAIRKWRGDVQTKLFKLFIHFLNFELPQDFNVIQKEIELTRQHYIIIIYYTLERMISCILLLFTLNFLEPCLLQNAPPFIDYNIERVVAMLLLHLEWK